MMELIAGGIVIYLVIAYFIGKHQNLDFTDIDDAGLWLLSTLVIVPAGTAALTVLLTLALSTVPIVSSIITGSILILIGKKFLPEKLKQLKSKIIIEKIGKAADLEIALIEKTEVYEAYKWKN